MRTPYYREQALEGIAREVITAYDPNLYYGVPRMIPIEDIIEAQGITLEYQCLRKTGCVLGETIFDDGGTIIYDYDMSVRKQPQARRKKRWNESRHRALRNERRCCCWPCCL